MVGFEIFLDVVAVCFVFLLVGRDRNAPAVEVEAEATLAASAKQHAQVEPVPDVDLPDIGELFAEADEVGDRYLAPQEVEEREAAMAAIAEVFSGMPPHRPGGGRRRRIEALFAQADEMRQRTMVSDAALLTVAKVAVNALAEEGEALTAQRV